MLFTVSAHNTKDCIVQATDFFWHMYDIKVKRTDIDVT
jgi:hypothetical protein